MARRQAATKSAIPVDNSTPTAEQRRTLTTSQPASQAAKKEDNQNGSQEDSTSEQQQIPAGDWVLGKQEASGVAKDSSAGMIQGKEKRKM